MHAKAVFLAKTNAASQDPSDHRALLILSAVYRKWAGYRNLSLRPWVDDWCLDEHYSGKPGMGSADASYRAAFDLEEAQVLLDAMTKEDDYREAVSAWTERRKPDWGTK